MKQREILFILISIFIIVFAWVGFNIYHNTVSSTIPEPLSTEILPINPNFDNETIEKLKKRVKIEPILEMQKEPETQKNTEEKDTSELEKIIETQEEASPSADQTKPEEPNL